MARFAFKLDPVLRHRRMIEEERQRALAQLLRRKLILETQVGDLQRTIVTDKRAIVDALVGKVDVMRIRQHGVHSNHVALRVQQIAIELYKLAQQLDQSRVQLLEATKARKAVELLRQKRYDRWMSEQRRDETRQADELTTQAYARRMTRGGDDALGAVA